MTTPANPQKIKRQATRWVRCQCGKQMTQTRTFTHDLPPGGNHAAAWRHLGDQIRAWRPTATCRACRARIVLKERRKPVVVNAIQWTTVGGPRPKPAARTVRYTELSEAARRLFDRQMAAYRAAVNLARASTAHAAYGVPLPSEPIEEWMVARVRWRWVRGTDD